MASPRLHRDFAGLPMRGLSGASSSLQTHLRRRAGFKCFTVFYPRAIRGSKGEQSRKSFRHLRGMAREAKFLLKILPERVVGPHALNKLREGVYFDVIPRDAMV